MTKPAERLPAVLITVLALAVCVAIFFWLNRDIIWPKWVDDYAYSQHITQANLYLSEGNYNGIIAELSQALQIKPDSVGLLDQLAWVFVSCPQAPLRDGSQ